MNEIDAIRKEITAHPSNAWARKLGYKPVFTADRKAKISIIGQAPGIKAQTSHIPWDDASGRTLLTWLGISRTEFLDPTKIALIPMDFYYPGKGKSGDIPPRKEFAPMWHPQIFELMPKIHLNILIGQYSQKYYLKDNLTLTGRVKNYKEFMKKGYLPLPHPSPRNNIWQKKNPWFITEVVPYLQKNVAKILE